MKVKALVVIGFIVLIAVLTNPSLERHKEAVKRKFNEYIQNSNRTDNAFESAGIALGSLFGNAIIDKMVSSNNYLIFSTTQLITNGKYKQIGIGAFGNVFIFGNIDKSRKTVPRETFMEYHSCDNGDAEISLTLFTDNTFSFSMHIFEGERNINSKGTWVNYEGWNRLTFEKDKFILSAIFCSKDNYAYRLVNNLTVDINPDFDSIDLWLIRCEKVKK